MSEQPAETILRSRLAELQEKVREQEDLVRALQAGEVDAVVLLEKRTAKLAHLKSDEPLYRTLVDKLPQGVATVLPDGTIVFVNDHLARSLASPLEKLLGGNLLSCVTEGDRPIVAAMLQKAVREPQELETTLVCVDGNTPAIVSATRLPISGVDAIGVVIVDITDQLARRAAEEASRAKDELIAAVSHELRTPLTSIMGWVQMLEMQISNQPRLSEAVRNLKNAVLAETKIVEDLLDLSRSENGALSVAMQQFDLCETIRTAVSFVALQAENKSIALQVGLPDRPVQVRGDSDRLRQVFVNLLSNAVKFTSEGSVSVRAVTDSDNVTVVVADTGMGIVPEFVPFIFEPFRRSAVAQSYPGLGIGLAIARRLVEVHGGTISASSDGPGRGATFTVRLPLV